LYITSETGISHNSQVVNGWVSRCCGTSTTYRNSGVWGWALYEVGQFCSGRGYWIYQLHEW